MKQVFINTKNYQKFRDICAELTDPAGIGPTMAMVTGRAGRGKTEAAKKYAVDEQAVYIPPLNIMSPVMMLREICFDLASLKPHNTAACIEIIASELSRQQRLVIVDEADLLQMKVLEMLRGLNERCGCPVLLIGEEGLKSKIATRRRLFSRIRRSMEFGPVTQPDLTLFYKQALGLEIEPRVAAVLYRHCRGDWRPAITTALAIERAVKASKLAQVPYKLAKEITHAA